MNIKMTGLKISKSEKKLGEKNLNIEKKKLILQG